MREHRIVKTKRRDPVIRWVRNKGGKVVDPTAKRTSRETSKQEYKTRVRNRVAWYVPRFARTRRIVIKRQHGQWVAECSCKNFIRNQKACSHVYAILKRHPKVTDATIRHWNIYHRDFKKDPVLTEKMLAIKKTVLTGVPIELEDLITEGKGRTDLEFHTEALGVPVLKGPSFWTEVKGYKVMSDFRQVPGGDHERFGVVSETHLSERQQAINEEAVTVPMDLDDSDNCSFFAHEGDDQDVDMPDAWNDSNVDSQRARRVTYSHYLEICTDTQTPEELERFRKLLVDHRRLLAGEHSPAETQHNPQGMATLPNVQTSRAEKRYQALRSPNRRGEKKKRR